jgi:hypothetical protein
LQHDSANDRFRRGLRAFLYVSLALLGYFVVATAQRSVRALPDELAYRAKFDQYAADADLFDAVYVGSSLTYRAFQPVVIDPIVSRSGVPFRSYNLGLGGSFYQQNNADIDLVLENKGSNLELIVLELPYVRKWSPRHMPQVNVRTVLDHSPRTTRVALASLRFDDSRLLPDQLRIAARDLGLLARWHASVGQGLEIMRGLFGIQSEAIRQERRSFRKSRGYRALEAELDTIAPQKRRTRFLRSLAQYERRLSRLNDVAVQPDSIARRSHQFKTLVSQAERIRRAGIDVVWVAPPTTSRNLLLDLIRQQELPYPVIDLSDANKYPKLFQVGHRFDSEHLSLHGSTIFSRKFAKALLAYRSLREHP